MKSVFKQDPGSCYICEHFLGQACRYNYLEEHHIFYGTANRAKSEKYGLKVKLCMSHHKGNINGNKGAVHFNPEYDRKLKEIGQRKFEENHSREEFRKEFGKSWL